jgi:hypothetical protein
MEGSPVQEQRAGDDRRSTRGIGGRRQAPRRAEDRAKLLREMAALVIALCGGLAVIYLFFAAMGAVDIGEAATASAIALGLGLVWLLAFGYRLRTHAARSAGPRADKERRGF